MRKHFIIAMVMTAIITCCQKEEALIITTDSITINKDMTVQIDVTPMVGITYLCEDDFYATVDENGIVKGKRVGKTNIIVISNNVSKTIPVTIVPNCLLFDDLTPYIGASASKIKSTFGDTFEKNIGEDGAISYIYTDYTSYAPIITFKYKSGICSTITVMIPTEYGAMLSNYLNERYAFTCVENNTYSYRNHGADVTISYSYYSKEYIEVSYMV